MFTWSVDRVETGDKDLPTQVKDYMKWHHINDVAMVSGKKRPARCGEKQRNFE